MFEKVKDVIDKIKPVLKADGGNLELIEVTADGIVKLKLLIDCGHCAEAPTTLKMGIEAILKKMVPEIKEVVIT